MNKIIVAGGRDFKDWDLLKNTLDRLLKPENTEVVCGGAKGADALGAKWARLREAKLTIFPANWREHGKAAGPIRNTEMAEYATHLIAFWDGKSRGTKHMIEEARIRNLHAHVIKY